jgi:hypothetical protein
LSLPHAAPTIARTTGPVSMRAHRLPFPMLTLPL